MANHQCRLWCNWSIPNQHHSAFVIYHCKNGTTMGQYLSSSYHLKTVSNPVTGEVSYHILTEFGVNMRVLSLSMKPSVQVNIYKILINFLFYKTWNKELLHSHWFSTLLQNVSFGWAMKANKDWQWMVLASFWSALDVNLLGENIHSIKAIKSFISVQM